MQEGQHVPTTSAPIAKEVLDYLRREHGYGNRVTGKGLNDHFQGIGYGWDTDMIRLMLAVLLRDGRLFQHRISVTLWMFQPTLSNGSIPCFTANR